MSEIKPQDGNEKPGLLHHQHPPVIDHDGQPPNGGPADGVVLDEIDAYHPDTHHADEAPTLAEIEEAAGESHHGLIRERGPKVGREEEAKLALEHTIITLPVSWMLSIVFLLTIFSVPVLQQVLEMRRNLAERRAEAASGQVPQGPILPGIYNALQELPSQEQIRDVRSPQQAWSLIPSAQRFKEHEDLLQEDSYVVQWTLPRVQNFMIGVGVGNEQAYCGLRMPSGQQWLHYRPDVDYVTSRGFLDPALQRVRKRSGDVETEEVQPDPVRAIARFNQQLAQRGIELIVMPMPVKAMMHPETLSPRFSFGQGVLQNPSYPEFRQALAREGVKVFDVSGTLVQEMRRTRQAQYLETDTHWTPQAMELAARQLAKFIQSHVALPPQESVEYTRQPREVSNFGDITEMLRLPENQQHFKKQKVRIQQVSTSDGELWYPSRDADVLLLGDSFSNIYSLEGMNWGEASGFAEQLSFALRRPVDSIINNAGGSHVTRERLVTELKRGKDRLAGKRVVVWEFAMRDLLIGDWKILDLPPVKPRVSAPSKP
jgi:alginate O-acetyltransferase complex protein AlgJ